MANRRTRAKRRINLYRQSPESAPEPRTMRLRVLRRDRCVCHYCREPADTVDHVLPRCEGGLSTLENLVACCQRCNNLKGDMSVAAFLVVLAELLAKR